MSQSWEQMLDALLRERGRALFGYAFMMTGDRHVAEDVLQDALVRTFRSRAVATSLDAAHAYVKAAIATTAIDHRRRASVRRESSFGLVDQLPSLRSADHAERVSDMVALAGALRQLPARERACTVMRYLDGMSVAEISATLGIADGTVKRYLSDARAGLAAALPGLSLDSDEVVEVAVVARRMR